MKTRKLYAIVGPIKAWDWDTVTSIRGKNDACEKTKRLIILLLLMAMVFGLTGPAQAYTFVTLDIPGAIDTQARDINDSGDIVGWYEDSSFHGFVYEASAYTTLDVPGASGTQARGINDSGDVVGNDIPSRRGFVYESSTYITLEVPNSQLTLAFGINDSGLIVGYYADDNGFNHGFVYNGSTYTTLDYPDAMETYAYGVNDSGDIVGEYFDSTFAGHGFFYDGSTYTMLDVPTAHDTAAFGVNDLGDIVGEYFDDSNFAQGFVYDGITYTTVNVPDTKTTSVHGVNDSGDIVGYYTDFTFGRHGFIGNATPVSGPTETQTPTPMSETPTEIPEITPTPTPTVTFTEIIVSDTESPPQFALASPISPCVCPEIGDSIYLFSGEFWERTIDLQIPGRGMDFKWSRKYRSQGGLGSLESTQDSEMGKGWDYSYNIWVEEAGGDLILHDGNTRGDRYTLQPNGTWTRREFFRESTLDATGVYTVTFADTGKWIFHPFDGRPEGGKISSIINRNGNTLLFGYDSGRLATITDTLDREILVAYDANGFISSVTDFMGRTVSYEHYDGIEPGGGFGDLKSATTPAVKGTPNGNDFPDGKTTVYTYTTGFANDDLNHNILTITDPKGQTYLTNVYSDTTDPSDLLFDRVIRQTRGNPGDIIDISYVPLAPKGSNGSAVIRTIINDRVGNVGESFYDIRNRLVVQRHYTGRADPDLPTTEGANRPTGQLRPGDPAFFETRYEHNDDSLATRIVYPNGDVAEQVHEADLPGSTPSARSRGNLRTVRRVPGPLGADQNEIVEEYEYDTDLGGCCGFNFVTRHVDGRQNVTVHDYDASGNRIRTIHRIPSIVENWTYNQFGQMTSHLLPDNGSGHRRMDRYTYYDSGPQRGYLHQQVFDASNFALTTTNEYDLVGNVTRTIDARGNDILYVVNELDQVERTISREVTLPGATAKGPSPAPRTVRYEIDIYFDANDNVVRVDIQNYDDQGVLQPNTHYSTITDYEILNYPVRACREVGDVNLPNDVVTCGAIAPAILDQFITTEIEYDANRNLTLTRSGEATNGNQPSNVIQAVYDERDLAYQVIRAPGDPGKSTTQYDYDPNLNTVRVSQGLEDTPRITESTYDGFDRVDRSTDPMGNTVEYHYDENDNVVSERSDGELIDVAGDAGNVRLSETTYFYDAMDRAIQVESAFFDADTQTALMGGQALGMVIARVAYSDNSQILSMTDDNGHATTTGYDTANRMSIVADAVGNTRAFAYDANSNITRLTEVEKSDLGNPDEVFVTTSVYDNLDRFIRMVDNVGNTHTVGFDSRNNRTVKVDALGNETRSAYDGINRVTSTIRDLDRDGADGADPDIETAQGWDDSSRLTSRTDDNGNKTSYAYDALNRKATTTYADRTSHFNTFDVHHNVLTMTDANGSVASCDYDLLDRLTAKTIVPGPGVSDDTTMETYEYDGLSRLKSAEDDDSLVTRSYDSLNRETSETLNGETTTRVYDGVGNTLSCAYPGGRIINCTFDEVDRKQSISDTSGTIATYAYIGQERIERREYGNGTRTDYQYDGIANDPGDFGVKQIVGTSHSKISDETLIDDRTYAWDRMYKKVQRKDVRPSGPLLTHNYGYDAIYRLTRTTVDSPAKALVRSTTYALDGVGNRISVKGSPNPGVYSMEPTIPEPADSQMNQYSQTAFDGRMYDENGDLILITSRADVDGDGEVGPVDIFAFEQCYSALGGSPTTMCAMFDSDGDGDINHIELLDLLASFHQPTTVVEYDYRNQIVAFIDGSKGQVHTYAYDALGRRIQKIVDSSGAHRETRYYYDGWQVIEERDGSAMTQATYVYGLYIDQALNMRRGAQSYYYHTDDHYNVMAITDTTGAVRERYEYDEYGSPFDPVTHVPVDGNPSLLGNPYLFQGRRLDPETGLYYFRQRYLDPEQGRFVSRDPLGLWGDPGNRGNAYSFCANDPVNRVDPFGLGSFAKAWEEWQAGNTWEAAKHVLDYGLIGAVIRQCEVAHAVVVEGDIKPLITHVSPAAALGIGIAEEGEGAVPILRGKKGMEEGLENGDAVQVAANVADVFLDVAGIVGGRFAGPSRPTTGPKPPAGTKPCTTKPAGGTKKPSNLSGPSKAQGIGKTPTDDWHQGTFPTRERSAQYHFKKHGKGRTLAEYTKDALDFFKKFKHLGEEVIMKDGTTGIRIRMKVKPTGKKKKQIGGYWTQDGKVVTFFGRDEWLEHAMR